MMRLCIAATVLLVGFSSQARSQNEHSSAEDFAVFADIGSYQRVDFARCAELYLGSLTYRDCDEIVECGLAQVVMLKLAQPLAEHNVLRNRIDELAISGKTPAIRYKAHLTTMVFDHPEWFAFEKYCQHKCGDTLFGALAARVQKKTLAL